MFLLTEHQNNIEVLHEETSTGRKLYIEGNFLQAEDKNRNGRIYPKSVMEPAVETYIKDYIMERRSIGELNHPARPFADPAEAALMVESLNWKGNYVEGKARVLNTPKGQIIAALLEANFKLGVSSRGLGDVVEQKGTSFVKSFMLNAIDGVDNPSGQRCYVNAMTESVQWIQEASGVWVQRLAKAPLDEKAILDNMEQFLDFLKKNSAKR